MKSSEGYSLVHHFHTKFDEKFTRPCTPFQGKFDENLMQLCRAIALKFSQVCYFVHMLRQLVFNKYQSCSVPLKCFYVPPPSSKTSPLIFLKSQWVTIKSQWVTIPKVNHFCLPYNCTPIDTILAI